MNGIRDVTKLNNNWKFRTTFTQGKNTCCISSRKKLLSERKQKFLHEHNYVKNNVHLQYLLP